METKPQRIATTANGPAKEIETRSKIIAMATPAQRVATINSKSRTEEYTRKGLI
mgnify:CR=1 FL=1